MGVWLALASVYARSILESVPHLVETTELEQKFRSELKMIGKHAKELAMPLQNNHVHKYQRRSELTSMFMILDIVPCSCGVKTARAGGVAG